MKAGYVLTVLLVLLVLAAAPARAEIFVDAGLHAGEVKAKIALIDDKLESSDAGLHLGVGVRRAVAERSEIGVRLELADVDGDRLLAVRAFDYGYRLPERFTLTAFVGAARLDLATPAYGYWYGGGLRARDVLPQLDVGAELRLGDKIARDNLLPDDPQGGSPDNFYDLTSLSLYLSYRF